MHSFGNHLAVRDRLYNRSRPVNNVTAWENSGARGVAVLVSNKQTVLTRSKSRGGFYNDVLRALAYRNYNAVSLVKTPRSFNIGKAAVLVLYYVTEDYSLVNYLPTSFSLFSLRSRIISVIGVCIGQPFTHCGFLHCKQRLTSSIMCNAIISIL